MAGKTPFNFSLPIAPSSGATQTGEDFMEDFRVDFGGISVGNEGGAGASWVSGLVRDVTVGLIVAMAAKWAWSKIK